jgi:hypothetical protein
MKISRLTKMLCYTISLCLLFQAHVYASSIRLPPDTRVYVETKQDLIAKGDRVQQGQVVRSQVWRDVVINGHVLIAAGTPVIAKVDQVKNRQIAGVKGSMTIGAYETESVDGQVIQLSGGYHKEGKSRMALSITLGVLFILPILIPGKAAELPAGTVFDAYIDRSWQIDIPDTGSVRKLNLTNLGADISAELLYEKFENEEKPKYFEFQITVPQDAPRAFVIDRVNSEAIKPLKLKNVAEYIEDDEAVVNAQIKIKTLLKKFAKGINTIEIASIDGDERVAILLTIDIEI